MMYRYRGRELSGMNRYEYFCTVKVIKVKVSLTDKKSTRGRKSNKQYEFENEQMGIRMTMSKYSVQSNAL